MNNLVGLVLVLHKLIYTNSVTDKLGAKATVCGASLGLSVLALILLVGCLCMIHLAL